MGPGFEGAAGLFVANPALVSVSLAVRFNRLVRTRPIRVIGRRLVRMARTSKPRAQLRMMEYRSVMTATMSYDALPINDHFRRVDADTVIGLMDFRSIDRPFLSCYDASAARTHDSECHDEDACRG